MFAGVTSIVSCLGPDLCLYPGRWTEIVSARVSSGIRPLPCRRSKTWSGALTVIVSVTTSAGRPSPCVRAGYDGSGKTTERRNERRNWRKRSDWRTTFVSWANRNEQIQPRG